MGNLYIFGLLLLISTVNCQYYNSDYSVTDDVDDSGEHSSYTEEDDKPDYSKYYQKDTSAPLVASPILSGEHDAKVSDSGFVSPLDFSGFISASHFGLGAESSPQKSLPAVPVLNPFHVQEGAATKESSTGFVDPKDFHVGFSTSDQLNFTPEKFEAEAEKIGQLFAQDAFNPEKSKAYGAANPAPETSKKYSKSKYGSEAEDLEPHAPVEHAQFKAGKGPVKQTDYENNSGYKKPDFDYSAINPTSFQTHIPDLSSYTSGGKTSHVSPVKNYAPQFYPESKYSNVQAEKKPLLTPYQKYSFQPVAAPKLSALNTGINLGLDSGIGAGLNLGNLNIDGFKPISLEHLTAGNLKTPQFESLKSTKLPFNPSSPYVIPSTAASYFSVPSEYSKQELAQPTEHQSEKLQGAECQRLEKYVSPHDISHGRFRRQSDAMNCFVCKDPKTGGSYEKCSYSSDPKDDNSYFRGHAEKYSTKTYSNPEHNFRKRRATKDDRTKRQKNEKEEKEAQYKNPYDFDKEYSHKFNSKPEEFEKDSYYKAPDFSNYETSANYDFSPEYFSESSSPGKSFSELKSEELKKDPGNCQEIEKDSMTCLVCSNAKTGGTFEQCSYTAAPKQKKFAFVKEKKFNSNDPIVEEKTIEQIDDQPTVERISLSLKDSPEKEKYSASATHPKQKKLNEEIYEIPERFTADDSKEDKFGSFNLDQFKTTDNDKETRAKVDRDRVQEHEDYLSKLFPQYADKQERKQESKQNEKTDIPEYFTGEESKKDVDTVLEEFAKKDRSKCKKIAKNKMTCYLCVDDKGIQHEECMFVSESQPKSSHIAYHEVKQFKSNPDKNNGQATADTKQTPEVVSAASTSVKSKRKAFPKKVPAVVPIKDVDAEPTEVVRVTGNKTPRIVRRKTNLSKEYAGIQGAESKQDEVRVKSPAKEEEKEPELATPVEVKEGADGAYASELKPVFSKKLGVTLPAYMLEISEGEKIFDEAVKAGR